MARTGTGIYLGYKHTQRKVRGMPEAQAEAEWSRRHELAAEALYELAIELKGLFVKTGQFIGTRSDIVPVEYSRSLSRLQDRVPAHPVAEVRRTIEEQLGRPVKELFATFDDMPVGAASLAQAHRATLPDGREVVVKVQYPEVADLIRLDIRNLRVVVGLVARREPNFDYRAIVTEIANQVPLEVDFVREAEMTRRVAANLAEFPWIVIPGVIADHVAKKVLVTEYLHGKRLLDAAEEQDFSGDGAVIAERIAGAYGHQIMIDGLFQADPHPGNILVLPGARIGLLDFGLTKELPDAARLGFARLVIAVATRDSDAIAAAFRELGVKTKSDDPAEVMSLMRLFFDARPGGNRGVDRNGALRRNPVEAIPSDLVLLGRVVGLLRGVCSSLGAPLSPMQMLRPYAERALATAEKVAAS